MKLYLCWDINKVQSESYNIGLKLFKNTEILKKYEIEIEKDMEKCDVIFYFMNMGWDYYTPELSYMWTNELERWSAEREIKNIEKLLQIDKKLMIYLRGDGASIDKNNIDKIAMNNKVLCVLHDFHLNLEKIQNPVKLIKDYHHLSIIDEMNLVYGEAAKLSPYIAVEPISGGDLREVNINIELWGKKFKPFTFLFDNYGWLYKKYERKVKIKDYDIFYVKNGRSTLDGLLREKTRQKLKNLPYKKCMKRCRKDQYDLRLAKSKICVSTWGMGECVYDDWKAILNETILLKIDTSHVIDYYGIYNEENEYIIYYKHDLSDLREKINHILKNYDYYLKRAKVAKQKLLEFTEEKHIKDFKEIIGELF